jgi:predicted transcriptional regulator YdeE
MTKTEIKHQLESLPEAWKDLLKDEITKPYYQNLIDTFESYNIDPRSYRIHAAGQYEIYKGGK